jgi:hypothetical protein
VSDAEATAAAVGGVVAPSSFEAALLVSAWANEAGRELEDWQFDAYQALVEGKATTATFGRLHGRAHALREAEALARWLQETRA